MWNVDQSNFDGDAYGDTEEIPSAKVTADFFSVLGVEPLRGRLFLPEEVVGALPRLGPDLEIDLDLGRAQIEFVAARTSLLNDCFF